jgi:hypothetical protein
MKTKNLLFLTFLALVSFAAYAFLFQAKMADKAAIQAVEDISTQIRSVAEPVPSPDVHAIKSIIKAFVSLLPAS